MIGSDRDNMHDRRRTELVGAQCDKEYGSRWPIRKATLHRRANTDTSLTTVNSMSSHAMGIDTQKIDS